MTLAVGGTSFSGAYVGSSAVSAIYLGSDKVWPTSNNWLTTSNLLFTYTAPATQYEDHNWDSGTISGVDTGAKWVGALYDRVANININGGLNTATNAQITLEMYTADANPGAGSNTGFTTFKLLIGGNSGWSPSTLNLSRTSATYSSAYNASFGYYIEQWVWDGATTGLTRASNGNFRMLAGSGLLL